MEANANGMGRSATPIPIRAAWATASGSLKMSRGLHGTACSAMRRDRSTHGRTRPVGVERPWVLRSRRAAEQARPCKPRLIFSDPEAVAQAARMGVGVALLPMPFAFASIRSGELVRLLPGWYGDAGSVSIYYSSKRMLPSKTRAFVDFVLERFRSAEFARLVDGR